MKDVARADAEAGLALAALPVTQPHPLDGGSAVDRVLLPADHPAWTQDACSLSFRARAFVAKLKPVALALFSFWDHKVRSLNLRGGTLIVDAAGCYRLE